MAIRPCSAKSAAHGLLVRLLGDGDHVADHHVSTRLAGGASKSWRSETTPSRRCCGVQHVGVVDGLHLLARLAAQVADGLVAASSPGARGRSAGSSGRPRRPRRRPAGRAPRGGWCRRAAPAAASRVSAGARPGRRPRRRPGRAAASTCAARPGPGRVMRSACSWVERERKKSSAVAWGTSLKLSTRSSRERAGQASRSSSGKMGSGSCVAMSRPPRRAPMCQVRGIVQREGGTRERGVRASRPVCWSEGRPCSRRGTARR